MFYNICHDRAVHYDLVSDWGVHTCSVCGRRWYCQFPSTEEWRKGAPVTWTSPPTFRELWRKYFA